MVGGSQARRRVLKKESYERTQRSLKRQLLKTNRLIASATSDCSTQGRVNHLHEYKSDLLRQLRRRNSSNTGNDDGASGSASSTPSAFISRRNRVSSCDSFSKHMLFERILC